MSKSLGNVYTIADLEKKGYSALDYRYFTFTSHYRNKLNFTWDALDFAKKSLDKARMLYNEHLNSDNKVEEKIIDEYLKRFEDAINDDFNMPLAIAVLWDVLKAEKSKDYIPLLNKMDTVFSLDLDKKDEKKEEITIPENIKDILQRRKIARENKDYSLSDKLRDEMLELGYKVIDSKEGQKIEKV